MSSAIDVCNLALSHIGQGKTITSLTEASSEARACSIHFDIVRRTILSDAAWGKMTKVQELALLDSTAYPSFDYTRAYAVPTDCLAIQQLLTEYSDASVYGVLDNQDRRILQDSVDYELRDISGASAILANYDNLRIKYTKDETDINKFSPKMIMAMSHLLAAHIATLIVGFEAGNAIANRQLQLYSTLISSAIAADLNQRHRRSDVSNLEGSTSSLFITSRL